jgi:hypothetical protein
MSVLAPEYLDPHTPPDVVVTDRLPPRITDPTLGEPLGDPPAADVPVVDAPTNTLVAVGDSLTHGMSSGAVSDTTLGFPALAASALGFQGFRTRSYGGPLHGLPLNIEGLLRRLEKDFGPDLNALDWLRLPITAQRALDGNEEYWERGGGHTITVDVRYHNLGIYGWDVRDALSYTAGRAVARAFAPSTDTFAGARPEHDNDIAAYSVLGAFGLTATQVGAAEWFGRNGGIDVLVVALGANNALRSVVDKRVNWSGADYADLGLKGKYNVWRPGHFSTEYTELIRAVRRIRARRVVLATVPHVTIAPIARGVNPAHPGEKWRPGSRFFPYYTDPWVSDGEFRPDKHRHLTHQQARAIDSAIDQYNETIAASVRDARREGRDWRVLDLCGILDGLAHRRFHADNAAAAENDWVPYPLPAPLAGLDSRFYRSDRDGRSQGGLFGLDAIHPSVCGYGVMAQALLDILADDGQPAARIDFTALRNRDTLNSKPPALFDPVLSLLTPFLTTFMTRG